MRTLTAALAVFICFTPAEAASDGRQIAAACAACHGAAAAPEAMVPLAALAKADLAAALAAYRNGERESAIMQVIAAQLDLTDVMALQSYLAETYK